jgi:hypothetical protein
VNKQLEKIEDTENRNYTIKIKLGYFFENRLNQVQSIVFGWSKPDFSLLFLSWSIGPRVVTIGPWSIRLERTRFMKFLGPWSIGPRKVTFGPWFIDGL